MSNSKVPDNPLRYEEYTKFIEASEKGEPAKLRATNMNVVIYNQQAVDELITSEADKRVEAVLDRLGEKFNVLETKGEALSAIRAERQRLNKEKS